MRIIILAVSACAIAGTALADTATVAPETWDAYKGVSLTTITHKPDDFVARTSGRAAFAMFGAFAMISEGNKIVSDNHIVDPVLSVAAKLSTAVSIRLKPTNTMTLADTDSNSTSSLADAAGDKGLVLDVVTSSWGFGYFPFNWSHYHLEYETQAKLIDAATKRVVAKASCEVWPREDTGAPNYDAMLADDATLLKKMLASAGDFCVISMENDLLGTSGTTSAPAPVVATPIAQ